MEYIPLLPVSSSGGSCVGWFHFSWGSSETGEITELFRFTGGQGTINVPSWSPDGKRFAFVSYHIEQD